MLVAFGKFVNTGVDQVDFGEATDRLMLCHGLKDVADAAGANYQTVRQARLAADHPNSRPPPTRWRSAIAKLARERAAELVKLAEELEG